MRSRPLALVLGLVLAAMPMSTVLADTGPGGGNADLGLESVTITGGTVASKTSLVTMNGSITCTQDLTAFVEVDVSQVVGRFNTIRGFGGTEVTCLAADGTASFSTSFFADQGKFAPGNVTVNAFADVSFCDEVDCFDDSAFFGPATIHLGRH